jgi:hypothetical protein
MKMLKSWRIKPEVFKAAACGALSVIILAALIVTGSRNLSHFDAALVGYTFAVLFATFGIAYRYAMWLQRPPTSMHWKRGWQVFFQRRHRTVNFRIWVKRVANDIALNRFIFKRGAQRWLAHWLIMWGRPCARLDTHENRPGHRDCRACHSPGCGVVGKRENELPLARARHRASQPRRRKRARRNQHGSRLRPDWSRERRLRHDHRSRKRSRRPRTWPEMRSAARGSRYFQSRTPRLHR